MASDSIDSKVKTVRVDKRPLNEIPGWVKYLKNLKTCDEKGHVKGLWGYIFNRSGTCSRCGMPYDAPLTEKEQIALNDSNRLPYVADSSDYMG